MPATFTIREGVTDPLILILQSIDPDNHDATPVNLAGVTSVDVRFQSKDGSDLLNFLSTAPSPQVVVTDAANGQVTFTPGASDFDAGENWYLGFVRVVDAGGNIVDFPNDGEFELVIREAF